MIGFIFKKLIGSRNDREVKKLRPLVGRINEIEAGLQSLSEEDLRKKTADWKAELSAIEDNEKLAARLTEILPEAFAVVKNACRRLCGQDVIVRGHPLRWEMVPFDVQLIGGIALHTGKIAEMATGEGKTLVATAPVYSQCADRPRRACRDGQRLPRLARRRVDGSGLQISRPDGRLHPA
jgi:preprotein translocase subunit SecA